MIIDLGHPIAGDIVDLILADHRRLEGLLRQLRDDSSDRSAVRAAFADLLVAHGEAEEEVVYPVLRRKDAISAHEAEHGKEEHAEGNEALLALLELKGTDTQAFDDALEELSKVISHHLVEEELTILNPARKDVSDKVRAEVGAAFAKRRNALLGEGLGNLEKVRALVKKAEAQGLLTEHDEDAEENG